MSTYAERQAYRDSHPGVVVDNNSSSDGGFHSNTPDGTPSGGGGGGGAPTTANPGSSNPTGIQTTTNQTGANLAAGSLLLQQAQQAAYQAYLNAKLALDTDQNAWQKAAQEAATVIAQAGVTGTFNGQPTQAAIKQAADIAAQQASTMQAYATQFGVWGMPQAGQQTLQAQKQVMDMSQSAAQLTGWYTPYTYTPPTSTPFPSGTQGAGAGAGATAGAASGGLNGIPNGTFVKDADSSSMGQVQNGQLVPFTSWQQYVQAGGPTDASGGGANFQAPNVKIVPTATWTSMLSAPPPTPAATTTAATDPTTGLPYAPGQGPPQAGATLGAPPGYQAGQPIQTLQGNEQAYTQWLRSQQQSLAQWQAQQTASQNYLQMMSQLRGPADWAQYQKVLGATPQGTQDLVAAAAGQYIPGGGATTGVQPTPVSLQNFVGGVTGQQAQPGQAGGQSQLQNMQNTLVAPNQMAPQTWNALQPSQQQMLLGVWESQGYSKDDAQNLFKQSLPKYAAPASSSGSFRLQ